MADVLAVVTRDGHELVEDPAAVTLELHVKDGAPTVVRGDPERLGQLLQNLVDNALKFTSRGGRVDVRLSTAAGARPLLLEVTDTGCGVPPDALPRLFEPFFQVPANAGQGSGLGLAIVKAVVDGHGGDVDVHSTEGAGTTVCVRLPGTVPAQHEPAHAGAERSAPASQ